MDLPIFSPSQTTNYDFCPRYWALKRAGWVPRVIQYNELCQVVGIGFAKFVELLNRGRLNRFTVDPKDASKQAVEYTEGELLYRLAGGERRILAGKDREFADSIPSLVTKACLYYATHDILAPYNIVAVETALSDEDKARPDVVVSDEKGAFPVDYKIAVKIDKQEWIDKRIREYENHWNMIHYCSGLKTVRYAIVLFVLQPKPLISFNPFTLTAGQAHVFTTTASALWTDMQFLKAQSPRSLRGNTTHGSKFGPCEMSAACLEHELDESGMLLEYYKLPRRDDGVPIAHRDAGVAVSQDSLHPAERSTEQPEDK